MVEKLCWRADKQTFSSPLIEITDKTEKWQNYIHICNIKNHNIFASPYNKTDLGYLLKPTHKWAGFYAGSILYSYVFIRII